MSATKGKYEGLEVSLYKKNEKNEYVGQGQGYEESEVKEYELMDESTYQSDIDWKADFEEIYGDKDAKCLVVLLE